MNQTLHRIKLCIVGCLLAGCAAPPTHDKPARTPAESAASIRPVRPERGGPIDWPGWTLYFQKEANRLLRDGKIATNLAGDLNLKTCTLKLPSLPRRTFSPAELVENCEMAVGMLGQIEKRKKRPPALALMPGSGFFLTESGAFATCYHALEGNLGLVVMTRDGRVCPVREVMAVDPANDVMILQVEGEGFTPLPVSAAPPSPGAPVWVLSHPNMRYYTLSAGIVSGHFKGVIKRRERTFMNITADFANGSSGAPVLNDGGEVVALAAYTQALYSNGPTPNGYLQMMLKSCIPASALTNLIKSE